LLLTSIDPSLRPSARDKHIVCDRKRAKRSQLDPDQIIVLKQSFVYEMGGWIAMGSEP
jgi:hypothetical protein